ncbi:MAG TPA: phosphoribosyltransferase family protein [Bauldia sp.]|nr:phosphoribosyltransferase family protein [Bauldia sp.]
MTFLDRGDAGRRLAARLAGHRGEDAIVLALPRGGVPVAAEIAEMLHAPLDLIFVRKIGVPGEPELAMGAVVDGPHPLVVRNEDVISAAGATEADFASVRDRELAVIRRRRREYLGRRPHPVIAGRVVIVVDDGIATGATMRAALRATKRQKPKLLVVAVPVAATDALAELRQEADEVVCLERYSRFGAIGRYYSNFDQVPDSAVVSVLARFTPGGSPGR